MPSSQLSAACQWLVRHLPTMQQELISLCHLNSWSENQPGLLRTADHLEDLMKDLGVPCVRTALPPRTWLDDTGAEQAVETGPWLQWNSPSKNQANTKVLIGIHYDTVYPPSHSLQQCTEIAPGRLNGPGVIDAKGGILVMRWAMRAALEFNLLDRMQWTMVLNPDEEVGSPSSSHLWKELASQHDFGMLYEPTMADGSMVDSRKGSGNFLWLIRGRSAHSGRNFQAGRNAIVHAARLADALHRLNDSANGVTVNVGRIAGGGPLNVVPDLCALRMNIRIENPDQLTWVTGRLQALLAEYHQPEQGYQCQLDGALTSPPKPLDAATRLRMEQVARAAERVGQSVRWKASGGASDGNKLSAFGLPNIDTFGPDGDELHSQNEWIRLASLPEKAILSLATWCQIQEESP